MKAAVKANGNGQIAATAANANNNRSAGIAPLPSFFRQPAVDAWKSRSDAQVMNDLLALRSFCEKLIREAIAEAQKGMKAGRRPFGAVVATADGEIVGRGHNTMNRKATSGSYAEDNALKGALRTLRKMGVKNLKGCVMACTCEPTLQDMRHANEQGILLVVFGANADDARRAGFMELDAPPYIASESFENLARMGGVLRDECAMLMRGWKVKRKARKN